jgi:hypothetical protein
MTSTRVQTRAKPKNKYNMKPKTRALLDAGKIQEVIDSLTVRQRRFVEEYLVDFNGAAAVVRAGYNVKNHQNACRLAAEMLQHPAIKAGIDQITIERVSETTLKPEYVMNKIQRTLERAEAEGNHSAVLRACELMARAMGMFVERKEISGPNGDAIELKQVQEAADAFTSAISGLIERGREDGSFIIVGPEC